MLMVRYDSTLLTMTKYLLLSLTLLLASCGGGQPAAPPAPAPTVDQQGPTVSFISKSSFNSTEDVLITASAYDSSGVDYVEVLVDGVVVGRSQVAPYTVNAGKLKIGKHILKARAIDKLGNVSFSSEVSIDIVRAPTAIGGSIDKNTTLNAEMSPYELTSPMVIAPGVTLTIEPGVYMFAGKPEAFTGTTGITVHGTLNAKGEPGNLIKLKNIRIDHSTEMAGGLANVVIQHAQILDSQFVPVSLSPSSKSNITIEDSIVDFSDEYQSNNVHIIGNFYNGKLVMNRNIIHNATLYFTGDNYYSNNYIYGSGLLVYFNDLKPKFTNNSIIGQENSVEAFTPLTPMPGTKINVLTNYWGTTARDQIEKMILDGKDDYGQRFTIEIAEPLTENHPLTPIP